MAEKSEDLKTIEDKTTQAKELFARGSRNYLVKAYNDAADDLSQVCDLYEEIYGQLSDELGVPYLLYAKSLIALAEEENKVLSVPDEQNDDEDAEEDDEEDEGDSEEKDVEDNEAEAKQEEKLNDKIEADTDPGNCVAAENNKSEEANVDSKAKKTNGVSGDNDEQVESTNGQVDETEVAASTDADKEADTAQPGTSNGAGEEKENKEENGDEDDGANLQVAWEILELAVKIFERQGEPAASKLAEAYSELAGISFENSHFDAAIADFKKSLEIHMKLPDDNRRIVAEIHYKIGLAHLMQNSFDDCVLELKRASELIDEEIEEQKQKDDQTEKEKNMIKDLEETKQDILGKIAEVEETKTQSIEEVRNELSKIMSHDPKVAEGGISSSSNIAPGSSSSVSSSSEKAKPTDISHLIKRKKPDSTGGIEAEASPAKRPAV